MRTHHGQITVLFSLPLFVSALFFPHPASAGKGTPATELNRVAYAVEGAESSHGTNAAMWRIEPTGPQGPMQGAKRRLWMSEVEIDLTSNRTEHWGEPTSVCCVGDTATGLMRFQPITGV
jgi:hypothetical protein